ncbi:hypothetical protein DTO195F2_3343 [Paecilomyces variotii]|nr:hypothetical protein DTO195F2_3343 [Paecilomyces variotii]KAJ9373307.1 hypothetical protein DTO282E5_2043 [Paecilomyces variotii]
MSIPIPPVTLEGHCSAIHNNTLYVYTPDAFLSLPLELDGKWQKLQMGQAVTGAICVKGGTEGDNNRESLYVVGGTANSPDYSGLQRYSFEDKQWQTIDTPGTSLQNRTNHGAAYINSTASLLIYAGSQDGSEAPTTSTFLVSTVPPFGMDSFNSQGAYPAVAPMLLPWDEGSAALVGGDASTTSIFVFNSTGGWQNSGASLAQALPEQVQCALVSASDGSKILETFDMSTSPNTVSRVALLDAGGVPAPAGQVVGTSSASSTSATKTKRDLTLANYPAYNGTFAPNVTRTDFSLAQDGNGFVVISGGSTTDPLCIFDSSSNRWLNATKLFHGDEVQKPLVTQSVSSTTGSSTTSATAAATTSAISSPPAAATSTASGAGGKSSSRTGTIIGATLGGVLGFALFLVIVLLILRWLRQKKERPGANGQVEDKDRLSFQDRGLEPLALSATPMGRGSVPSVSADSLAIMSGKYNGSNSLASPMSQHGVFAEKNRSPLTTIMSSRQEATPSPLTATDRSSPDERPRGDRTTDEGWSKYFEDNNATSFIDAKSPRSTVSSDQTRSDYRGSGWPTMTSGLAPLNLGVLDDRRPLGRVPTGSPSTEHPSKSLFFQEGQSARISSADSVSLASDDGDYGPDAYSSGVPASIVDERGWPRPASSNYTNSVYAPTNVGGDTLMIPSRSASHSQRIDTNRTHHRGSSTVIPEHYDDDLQTRSNVNSDMSWLNLNLK